ncbi:MAG: class I SAM-dependent methyltransferase [Patescibacteria group bacterium]
MTEDVTKLNYEIAHDWHAEKSALYDWRSQIDSFLKLLSLPLAKVLDVGCGDERDIRTFREKGVNVEGLDYSHTSVEVLKQKFPTGKFYEADMRATGLESESYDGIWACASILNLKKTDVPVALVEFNRILKANGVLFISVKEGEGERMVPDKAGERFFSFYSEEELKRMIESASFQVVHTEVMGDTFSLASQGATLPRWISLYAKKI